MVLLRVVPPVRVPSGLLLLLVVVVPLLVNFVAPPEPLLFFFLLMQVVPPVRLVVLRTTVASFLPSFLVLLLLQRRRVGRVGFVVVVSSHSSLYRERVFGPNEQFLDPSSPVRVCVILFALASPMRVASTKEQFRDLLIREIASVSSLHSCVPGVFVPLLQTIPW